MWLAIAVDLWYFGVNISLLQSLWTKSFLLACPQHWSLLAAALGLLLSRSRFHRCAHKLADGNGTKWSERSLSPIPECQR